MPNPSNPTSSREAQAVIYDYTSIGAAPFGAIESEVYRDEWYPVLQNAALAPADSHHAGWMHVDHAFSLVSEAGLEGQPLPPELQADVGSQLQAARQLFRKTGYEAVGTLAARALISEYSLPVFNEILTQRSANPKDKFEQLAAQTKAVRMALAAHKKRGAPIRDIPELNALTGLWVFTNLLYPTRDPARGLTHYEVVPSSTRHSEGGESHYEHWQVGLYNCESKRFFETRLAPSGPPDMVTIHPLFLHNDTYPTSGHSRGTLEAITRFHHVDQDAVGEWRTLPDPDMARTTSAKEHVYNLNGQLYAQAFTQTGILEGAVVSEVTKPDDIVDWYYALTPFISPCHSQQAGRLEQAIAEIELKAAGETLSLGELVTLGWLHLESASSMELYQAKNPLALLGSFDRAEDLFTEATKQLTAGGESYYLALTAALTAPLQKAIASGEQVDEAIDEHCRRLTSLSRDMLASYRALPDKNSDEALGIATLLHRITACLLGTATPDKSYIVLPSLPRERGFSFETRGWDLNVWALGISGYEPAMFNLALADDESPLTLDMGIITMKLDTFGQAAPGHDFHVLQALLDQQEGLNVRPSANTTKRLKRARAALQKVLTAASGG